MGNERSKKTENLITIDINGTSKMAKCSTVKVSHSERHAALPLADEFRTDV